MKTITVVSGKGGTGKTSVAASFAVLAKGAVLADCDVDAPDLHLIFAPKVLENGVFMSGYMADIATSKCTNCGHCVSVCRFSAIKLVDVNHERHMAIVEMNCSGCGACSLVCPENAVSLHDKNCGEWHVSATRAGIMAHARLIPAADNSGKLVALVRKKAEEAAEKSGIPLIIVDGPPGISCPVIASLTGADLAVIVAEPTVSGLHDFERIVKLTHHFKMPTALCVNKYDINLDLTGAIEANAREHGVLLAGNIRYDKAVNAAQSKGLTIVEETEDGAGRDIRKAWEYIRQTLMLQFCHST
ncbi:MAG: ATP-binding protein [Fibrobacterota bacterium]